MGEDHEDPAYEAYLREQEKLCYAQFTCGPSHDPYGTSCKLEKGHKGPHRGSDPFGNGGDVEWEGGGSCAGDPLPQRNVRWIEEVN